jgi:RHS repeat-associated protein
VPKPVSSEYVSLTWTTPRFDSFGKLTASTGSLVNPFQYTARESDTETGLYYYRARYYDPSLGRFISEDPIQFGSDVNFFAYIGNSPTNYIDPLGLCKLTPNMKQCLENLFNKPVYKVKIVEKINKKTKWGAITGRDKITIHVPCDDFLTDPETVLEEYYHVLEQWDTGRLSKLKYAIEWAKHGYENNKYEIEAKAFAKQHVEELKKCLQCAGQ